ncbi:MAG: asparagine synthase (glutamine-hydrolyzing) [Chitinophagaceae bacterium]|nr:asparagine synthase (glutamine-hydrolyzing) [Chitinophagaceae bacterium]
MCGIAGTTIQQDRERLPDNNTVLGALAHRGPDGQGVFRDENLFLAHTRLAIQDTGSMAAQPMVSEDQRYVLVFNGEIYNHLELRSSLPHREFRSHSDTETLLYAYIQMGAAILPLLNGIFAFAVYDRETKELFLARDAFGVKPLYYYQKDGTFSFASETKCLFTLDDTDRTVNPDALFQALLLQWPIETGLQYVKRLNPGHCLIVNCTKPGSVQIKKWYREPFRGLYEQCSEQAWMERLDTALTRAVQRQLLSDKPLAYFLSGGLDSSLLAAIARKLAPGEKMQAYTIDAGSAFREEGFSADLDYALQVAAHLDIELEVIPSQADFLDRLDTMVWQLDEAQADIAPLFVQDIARSAKQSGYDVLIGGTGGDDVFSGYRRHQALAYEPLLSATPLIFRKAARSLLQYLPDNPAGRRLKKAASSFPENTAQRLFRYFFWTGKNTVIGLFAPEFLARIHTNSIEDFFASRLGDIPGEQALLNQALHLEMQGFLPCHNLNYTDKMGMAEGVEIRVPYLDNELVALAAAIPPQLKMKGSETKYLLKKVAERYLPKSVVYRPKTGFGAPLRTWMKQDPLFQQQIQQRLDRLLLAHPDIFNAPAVRKLYDKTLSGQEDNVYTLLALLAVESWLRQFAAS